MRKRIIWLVAAGVLIVVAVIAGVKFQRYREFRANDVDARCVYELIHTRGTFTMLRDLKTGSLGAVTIMVESGPLRGGRAVCLVNNDAAFWINDGTVFVVNDNARTLLPEQPTAPATITYDAIKANAK